ncbi:flagellar export protein FliJ [Marinimicrobium alkaliphilum]|uniref:flagellar export protein FliJ n=1 Tax=Marinimicrobium alkaliphilum TaxID=2202654 RepID=UPI000DBA16B3|nr:flagellar export protein FliJ [Marinimicrobium alkaliphilum]
MAERRSKRLAVVLRLAEQQEQASAQRLADYRAQVTGEQAQLEQLQQYAEGYLDDYGQRRTGLRGADMIAYSGFIRRLMEAQDEQRRKLDAMAQTLARLQTDWQEKYQHRQSVARLIERLLKEENQADERRLQKELDEFSAQQIRRRD